MSHNDWYKCKLTNYIYEKYSEHVVKILEIEDNLQIRRLIWLSDIKPNRV